MTLPFQNTLQFAQHLDQQDTLHHFRNQFHIPQKNGKELIYLCGNSLGLQPKKTKQLLDNELLTWQNLGVEGWFESDWLIYLKHLKKPLATLAGALPSEVTVMNNLTVNLHLMLATFYQPTPQKFKILTEAGAFPSDQYALETHLKFKGIDPKEAIIEIAPRAGEHTLRTEDILGKIEENKDALALVMMSGLNYYTGQVFDMQAIAKKSNELNISIGFDFCFG